MNFSGSAAITGNTMAGSPCNVYLDQDSDMVINAGGLTTDAAVGIYVPGNGDLFENRGDIGGRFGSYTDDANVDKFTNDRMPSLMVMKDANRKKLFWSKPVAVEARYLASFDGGLPPVTAGETKWTSDAYAPASSDAAMSLVAENIRANYTLSLPGDATYSVAFAGEGALFENYLTRLFWDDSAGAWMVEKRDGTQEPLGDRKLIIYYSLPACIVSVPPGGSLTIQNGAVLQNSRAFVGGAVYIVAGGTVNMTGGVIRNYESVGDGAGIYVSQGANLNISGNPGFGGAGVNSFGDIQTTVGNFSDRAMIAKTNGGKAYTRARQDIFIAGYEDVDAGSVTVNGRITSDDGTIWVWAERNPHYVQGEQFAVRGAADTGNLAAFRNAQDDGAAANTTDSYLYGMAGDGNNIIWSGVAVYQKVILQKVSADYTSLSGAAFTLYRGRDTGSAVVRDRAGNELRDITSSANGMIFVGELAEGIYYLHETTPQDRWFVVTVGPDETTCARE